MVRSVRACSLSCPSSNRDALRTLSILLLFVTAQQCLSQEQNVHSFFRQIMCIFHDIFLYKNIFLFVQGLTCTHNISIQNSKKAVPGKCFPFRRKKNFVFAGVNTYMLCIVSIVPGRRKEHACTK